MVGPFLNFGRSVGQWVGSRWEFKDIILLMLSVGFVDVVLKADEVLSLRCRAGWRAEVLVEFSIRTIMKGSKIVVSSQYFAPVGI